MAGVDNEHTTEPRTSRAVQDLGLWIASGIHEGTVMSLDEIAQRYGVSRPMAREACQILQAKGLVAVRQRVGITVRPQNEWQLYDPQVLAWRLKADYPLQIRSLTELRLLVEPQCARLAARRASSQQRGQLRGLAEQLWTIGTPNPNGDPFDREAFLTVDELFHHLLLAASGNEMFEALSAPVRGVLHARLYTDFPERPEPIALLLHKAVAQAVYLCAEDAASTCTEAILHEVSGKLGPEMVARVRDAFDTIRLATDENLAIIDAAASERD